MVYDTVDFEYWAKASFWTLEEAVALSFGKEPRGVRPLIGSAEYGKPFARRRELLERAQAMGQLDVRTAPSHFLAWARRMRFEMPAALIAAVEALGVQICDWKSLYDRQVEIARETEIRATENYGKYIAAVKSHSQTTAQWQMRIGELEGHVADLKNLKPAASQGKIGLKERESLLKIVIGMAVKGYAFNPKASRNTTAAEIAGDLQLLGLGLDEDTVRKYLAEGRQLLAGVGTG
jgi:hypothetical protein